MALLLASCQTAPRSGRDIIKLSGPYPGTSQWKTINRQVAANFSILERIPVEDNPPQNWTRLVGISSIRLSALNPEQRQDLVKHLKSAMAGRCPGGTVWNIIRNDENGVLYERFSKPCLGQPQEHTVGRVVVGKIDEWKLWYSKRVAKMPDSERDAWIDYFSTARITAPPATEVAQADARKSSTKYVNTDFGFTISLPGGWTFKEIKKKQRIDLFAPYPSGDKKGYVLIQYLKEWDMPLETAAVTHSTNLRNSIMSETAVKITVVKTLKTPLASGQFAAFIFERWQSTKYRNVSVTRINAYTLLGKKLFVISTRSNVDYWEQMQSDFQAIINSFAAAKQ